MKTKEPVGPRQAFLPPRKETALWVGIDLELPSGRWPSSTRSGSRWPAEMNRFRSVARSPCSAFAHGVRRALRRRKNGWLPWTSLLSRGN